MKQPKKLAVAGLLLVVLPLVFIAFGGVPGFTVLIGQGEGFAYFLAFLLILLVFVGALFLVIAMILSLLRRNKNTT